MIFLDTPLELFCKKHDLEVKEIECPNCGFLQKTTIPFIAKECVGLLAPLHDCGPDWQAGRTAPRNLDERRKWGDLVKDFVEIAT
jgi:hypothetical protein